MSKEKKANINIPKGRETVRRNSAGQQYYSNSNNSNYLNNYGTQSQFSNQNIRNQNVSHHQNATFQQSLGSVQNMRSQQNFGSQQNFSSPQNMGGRQTRATQQSFGSAQNMNPQQYFAAHQKALSKNRNYDNLPNTGQNPYKNNGNFIPNAGISSQAQRAGGNVAPNSTMQYGPSHARQQNSPQHYQQPNKTNAYQGNNAQIPANARVSNGQGQRSTGAGQHQNSGFDKVVSPTAYQGQSYQDPTSAFAPQGNTSQNINPNYSNNEFSNNPNKNSEYQESGNKPKKRPQQRSSAVKPIIALLVAVAVIFGLAIVLREYVFQAYEIPSGSMEETIKTGDMVFAEKVSHYFSSPKRGDIITFNDPEVEGRILIKRCIATAGQTVDIKNNKLVVDGVELDEPYTNGKPTKYLNRSKISFPYTIPEGHIWVMGDNRTNSQDSRYYGSIPVSSVIGKGLFVYWPTSDAKIL